MVRVVRESKFRHLYGQPPPKDQLFDGVLASNSRLDGNICAVNRKFIAVVLQSAGAGAFTILRRDKPGRVDRIFRCLGCPAEILDLCFDKFDPCVIAAGCEDGSFVVFKIPSDGLTDDLTEFDVQLKASQRRAVGSEWHPSAVDILIGVNVDSINVFNVATGTSINSIDTSHYCEQIYSFCLNFNGTKIVAGFKDKKVRVFDIKSGSVESEFTPTDGSKPIKVAWLPKVQPDGEYVFVSFSDKMSKRQVSVWKLSASPQLMCTETMDNATSPYNVYYDPDTKLIVLHGKGESTVKFFEFDLDPEPRLHNVASYTGSESHRAMAIGNKLSCNCMINEILHATRVLNKSLEEVAFIVPRKSDLFQDDLFPETCAETPAMTAEDYESGKEVDPQMISLKNLALPAGGSNSSLTRSQTRRDASDRRSTIAPSSSMNVMDIISELSQLKSDVADLKERLSKLEKS